MIVVAIIGLLAAIAIPSLMKARQTSQQSACINNLKNIKHAKGEWALSHNKNNGDAIVEDEVGAYIDKGMPSCPSGGTYTYGAVGTEPTCSISDPVHALP
jgi:type II secretory pathway pseudopilin PulG